ncbi:CHASE domain-containing protein [uncultured Kiloniella sp.]|uniref:CHASE domain-containing sensor histidine kinase n=1 Tax=uncultured Kiloniella sp. TaxID=1133091 RepID=UPI0026067B8E|nr:CHASE domain-containing protein [uncultured Kiloniella sp.]
MTEVNQADSIEAEQRSQLVRKGSLHWVHWLVVLLSIILTVGAWYIASEQVAQKNQEKFQRQVEQAIGLVEERMHLYENALWGGVAFLDANGGKTNYAQWQIYANSLDLDKVYPGINGIGVIYNIKPSQMEDYLASERKTRPNYALHPKHQEKEYWPITYIEPSESNDKAIGLDMAFESNRYTAIKKARDTGGAQITGPIVLVQDAKKTPGFLFYTPFYEGGKKPSTVDARRADIVGVTYAPFIMSKLMLGTLASENRQVRIAISDNETLLYADDEQAADVLNPRDDNPLFVKNVEIEMYGRTWLFNIESGLSFRDDPSNDQPSWILIGGLIIDSMLLGLFVFLTRVNRSALAYADKMTEALRDESQRLIKTNHDLEQFAYVASHDLKAPLNSINQVISWIEEDCGDLLPEKSKEHIDMVKGRCLRMMTLLKDLLDYSKVVRFAYSSEPVSLRKISNDVLVLHGKDQKFSCTAPDVMINIPRIPLDIVLRNLISNTIKHHDKENGIITISYDEGEQGHFIRVEDDGPGIPDKMHGKALEMFQTLQPRDKVEGSGMGLAMVKKIVEHHRGTFQLEKGRERGTCYIIFWPF